MLEQIQSLYQDYVEEYRQAEKTYKMGAGAFGLSSGPKDDPCHDRFIKRLERLLQETSGTDPEEAEAILDFVWFAPLARKQEQDPVFWMQLAAHSLTRPLISRLTPAAAAGLLKRYGKTYPRWERLPAQKELFSALKKRAGA